MWDRCRVINHEAGSSYSTLMSILQMHRQGPEKTTQRTGMSHWGTSSLSHPFHNRKTIITASFAIHFSVLLNWEPGWFSVSHLFLCLPSLPLSPAQHPTEAVSLRQRVTVEFRVLLWVSTSLHSSDFYCLEFVFSQRCFCSATYPPSSF